MMSNSSVLLVEKEQIKYLNFPKEDILEQREDQELRLSKLKRLISSNNFEKEKVKIFFADDSGLKKIVTTISSITEKSIILKQASIIPLQRVVSIA